MSRRRRRSAGPVAAAVGAAAAVVLVAGCGSERTTPSTTTDPGRGTTTVTSAPTLEAALLTPADVPGSTAAAPTEFGLDLSACFPGNPLGARTDPTEVKGPELDVVSGSAQRNYGANARRGTPEQAEAYITTFASAAGSACVLNATKALIGPDVAGNASTVFTGNASRVPVADGGALLPVQGTVSVSGRPAQVTFDLLAFRKGGVVVLLRAAGQGATTPGETVALAQRIAGRLP